ncbi:MAG: non-ribosomal peptide synthetase, partial [Planctomycetes bacterium]|nr:non-ribosomal peptide synthetase [Planctomycetota bacterium]
MSRIDTQVKVRGFRIELGDIESMLSDHSSVDKCVAAVREDQPGDVRLVGYIVAKAGMEATASDLRIHLRTKLPDYMVPQHFVELEELPLTPAGKVDRRHLPVPDSEGSLLATEYIAPRNETEEALVNIWQDLIGVSRIGIHDNFFDIGGHSLLATQVVSRIEKVFSQKISLHQFFAMPTVAELASLVCAKPTDGRNQTADKAFLKSLIPLRSKMDELLLSSAQQRLWYLDQLEPNTAVYNIPWALQLCGVLNIDALKKCLNEVVNRHEILRTTFRIENEQPLQIIASSLSLDVPLIDLQNNPSNEGWQSLRHLLKSEAQIPSDLARGPLIRAVIIKLSEEEHVFLFIAHHIV